MKKIINFINNEKSKYLIVIVLGSIFTALSCFHTNLWFDESYSIAISKQSFKDIWIIGSKDVHPVLYYILLKIVMSLTACNLICCRLFSCLPLIVLAILGYTHIRKDFGDKIGILFSILALIFPTLIIYAGEIRMYTWSMLFVTIMNIYANRILKNLKNRSKSEKYIKNWIIFSVFSLLSAYTHYYALIIAAIINVAIFTYLCTKIVIQIKENKIENTKQSIYSINLKYSVFSAIIQVLLYLPWLGILLSQAKKVSSGYWIKAPTPLEILEFFFIGNLKENIIINRMIAVPISCIAFIYFVYLLKKYWKNKDSFEIKICIAVFAILLGIVLLMSHILKQEIFYPRYMFNIMGLFIFVISVLLSKESKKVITIVLSIILIISTTVNIKLIKNNYNITNQEPIKYFMENYRDNDIVVTDNGEGGFIIISVIQNNNRYKNLYFFDEAGWYVDEAFKAFGSTIHNIEDFKQFNGRVWIISSDSFETLQRVVQQFENAKIIEQKYFETRYQNIQYAISLISLE